MNQKKDIIEIYSRAAQSFTRGIQAFKNLGKALDNLKGFESWKQ